VLFDVLNTESLSRPVVEQLLTLVRGRAAASFQSFRRTDPSDFLAVEAHNQQAALAIHVDLLTRGSRTDDIGLWMAGVKQIIVRL
jgi:protein transport protein SEC31